MVRRIGKPLWIVPLVIAGFVAAFGWWGNLRLRQTIEAQVKAELTVTLEANVTALEIWTTNQMRLATALAEEPKLRALANQVLDQPAGNQPDARRAVNSPQTEELVTYLRPRLDRVGYEVAELVGTNLTIAANTMRGRMRRGQPVL
jgi:hypothetical protein